MTASRFRVFLALLPLWAVWITLQQSLDVGLLDDSSLLHSTSAPPPRFESTKKGAADDEAVHEQTRHSSYSDQNKQQQYFVHSIYRQSICDAHSPFLSLGLEDMVVSTTAITTWATRLVYLTLFEHQNGYEYASNTAICTQNTTKFLIFSYGKNGLGANMRLAAVPALMLGLVTDRIVVNVNNAHTGPSFIREAWPWADCELGNAECYFRPLTTACWDEEALATAYVLTKAEARSAFRTGMMPEAHRDDRYLILHVTYRPQREPETLRGIVSKKVQATIERLQWTRSLVVQEALKAVAAVTTVGDGEYDYYGVNSIIFHGLLLYCMRPNENLANELKVIVDDVSQRFDNWTVGVPVRASDKCGTESQCLELDQYVAAAKEAQLAASSLFVTTESKDVKEAMTRFAEDYPLTQIFTNQHDVLPDTGFLVDSLPTGELGNVIPAALSSIQTQLRTSFVLGNCCSNFHLIIKDFVDVGCGIASRFQCLQTHQNKEYQLCCSWDKYCRLTPSGRR